MCGARVAERAREVVRDGFGLGADRARRALGRAPVRAGDDHVMKVSRRHTGLFQCVPHRRVRERQVDVLAESLLPLARRAVAGYAPAIEELRGRRSERDRFGDARFRGGVTAQERDGGIASVALVTARREAGADVGQHGKRGTPRVERGAQRTRARAHRPDHVERGGAGRQAQRRVDRRRVSLVEVAGIRGGEVQRRGRDARRAAQRRARGFDGHRGAVLVERGDGARALAGGNTEGLADRRAVETVVGHVDAVRE